jgi:hypothetical protein
LTIPGLELLLLGGPAHSQSLYRLRYPVHIHKNNNYEFSFHPASYIMVTRDLLQEVKWPRREANHSPPSSAEVKNNGATPPFPHMSSSRSA